MQYALLIYDNEKAWASMTEEERNAIYGEHYLGGNPLQPVHTATTLRHRNGKLSTTDGPFAETKEQLGGYYIVESDTVDEALGWAAKIPGAKYGSIEVRPVLPVGVEA